MDPSAYKLFTTTRDITYSYYFKAPIENKPYLLFLHGFPCSSFDWRHQIAFFTKEGYGIIVPDMLGYGNTSKPTDPNAYKSTLICKDLVEVLDNEGIDQSIVIGHDWGCKITSRLANYYPDRFIAFAFLAVGYTPPRLGQPNPPLEAVLAMTKQMVGYELLGYWKFFTEEGAEKILYDHWDSFMTLIYAKEPKIWKDHFAPSGTCKAWLLENKTTEIGDYITEEELKTQGEILKKSGLTAPFCYYKIMTTNISHDDDQNVPKENIHIRKPVFFGSALNDPVCLPVTFKKNHSDFCANLTVREYEAGHWVILEAHEKVNRDLLAWIEGTTSKL